MTTINKVLSLMSRRAGVALLTVSGLLCAASFRQEQVLENSSATKGDLLISLDGLLRVLQSDRGDQASAEFLIGLIELYGLNFRPTPDDISKLKKAAASKELLRAIEEARKPASPKPAVKKGELGVTCKPVECSVRLNGNLIGTTIGGGLLGITVPEGVVSLSAASPRYVPDREKQDILIRPNEVTRVQFSFKPSREILEVEGAKLFQEMLGSLSPGVDAIKQDALRITGTLYLHNPGVALVAWSLVAWLQDPHSANFEFARLREKYRITRTEIGYSWIRAPKTREAQDLEDAARLMVDWQLPRLVERLSNSHLVKVATGLVNLDSTPASFCAAGGSETYLVALDSMNRPSEVTLQSEGLSSGMRILYADYVQQEGVPFPKTIQIIFPDGAEGIEARFDTVQVDSSQNSYKQSLSKY